MQPILDISHLTRSYGSVLANDDVSLTVAPGSVVGLLGHNGAGKTTLVNQIVGLLKPDAGSIRIGSVDAVDQPSVARRHVAIQAQNQAPLDGLTPLLAIELAARTRGLSRRDAKTSARRLVEELDISEWAKRRAQPEGRGLSGGIRRLVAFAMALAAPTPLIVLDEPTNDVDTARRKLLWDAVRRRGDEGAGVLVVTHNVGEVERIADDLTILHRGKVVAQGTPGALTRHGDLRLELHLNTDDPGAHAPFPSEHTLSGRRSLLRIPSDAAGTAASWAADLRAGGRIDNYRLSPVTLESTYLELTDDTQELTHV